MTNRKKTETAEATNNCRLMSKENLAKKISNHFNKTKI